MNRHSRRRNRRRRTRRIAGLALLGAVGLALVVTPLWALGVGDAMGRTNLIQITVASGDTLWDLARAHGPEGADPRRTVDRICRLNGLNEATIYPQDRLLIPTR